MSNGKPKGIKHHEPGRVEKIVRRIARKRGAMTQKESNYIEGLPVDVKHAITQSGFCEQILSAIALDVLLGVKKISASQWRAHAHLAAEVRARKEEIKNAVEQATGRPAAAQVALPERLRVINPVITVTTEETPPTPPAAPHVQ